MAEASACTVQIKWAHASASPWSVSVLVLQGISWSQEGPYCGSIPLPLALLRSHTQDMEQESQALFLVLSSDICLEQGGRDSHSCSRWAYDKMAPGTSQSTVLRPPSCPMSSRVRVHCSLSFPLSISPSEHSQLQAWLWPIAQSQLPHICPIQH